MFFLQKHRFSNLFYLFFQICIASHIQIQAEKKKKKPFSSTSSIQI